MSRERFAKVTHDMPRHPKVLSVGYAARWLWIDSLTYCSEHLTDGLFPQAQTFAWSDQMPGDAPTITAELTAAGLWHGPGHACPRCVQPAPRFLVVHDYLDVQTSAADANQRSHKRRDAGSLGNHRRWCVNARRPIAGCPHCGSQVGSQVGSQTDRKPIAEAEAETESKQHARASVTSARPRSFDALTQQLAAAKGWPLEHCRHVLIAKRAEIAARPSTRNADAVLAGIVTDNADELQAPAGQRPPTAAQCDGTDCPGTRHEWADARNRFVCMGA